MTSPIINFKFYGLSETQSLVGLIKQKFTGLTKYMRESDSATCEVESSKISPQNNGLVYKVAINFVVDGTLYRTEAVMESFEKAIDEVRDELERKLKVAKEKQQTRLIKGGRVAKEQLLGV